MFWPIEFLAGEILWHNNAKLDHSKKRYSKENVSEPNFPLFDPPQPQGPRKARAFIFQQILTQQMLLNNFGSSLTLHTACMTIWMTKRQAISMDAFQAC